MKSNFPLISVGIPTYNNPKGLQRTLECITRQTYSNLEIIISDNCTEGDNGILVQKIVKDFAIRDSRVIFFKQSKNIFGNNFLFLLEKSNAEYFMWAADDDYWENSFIELCLQSLLSNKKFSSAFTFYSNVDLLGHKFRNFKSQNFGLKSFAKTFALCFEHEVMGKANPIYALHKKERLIEALEQIPFFPWFPFADVNIVMNLYFMGGISVVPRFSFCKTQPILHPYSVQFDEVNACRVPIILQKANRVFVKRLLQSSIKYKCFLPILLAILARCLCELYNFFFDLSKRILRKLSKF